MRTGRSGTDHLVEAMNAGVDDYIEKPFRPEELQVRIRAGRRFVDLERRLRHLAQKDALTGIWNRATVLRLLEVERGRARRHGSGLSLMMLDIDRFKRINDEYGHQVGDRALAHVAQVAHQVIRPYDLLGRYGGEEFLGVFPDTDIETVTLVAERVRRAIEEKPLAISGGTLDVTVSIGVAEVPHHDEHGKEAIHAADRALYRAKSQGRNRVERG